MSCFIMDHSKFSSYAKGLSSSLLEEFVETRLESPVTESMNPSGSGMYDPTCQICSCILMRTSTYASKI